VVMIMLPFWFVVSDDVRYCEGRAIGSALSSRTRRSVVAGTAATASASRHHDSRMGDARSDIGGRRSSAASFT